MRYKASVYAACDMTTFACQPLQPGNYSQSNVHGLKIQIRLLAAIHLADVMPMEGCISIHYILTMTRDVANHAQEQPTTTYAKAGP